MAQHIWGDEFDFVELGRAMHLIRKLGKLVNLNIMMKEKYGTIRYEMIFCWGFRDDNRLLSKLQFYWFQCCLFIACCSYQHLSEEILEDWAHNWSDDDCTYHYVPLMFKPFMKTNPWKYNNGN